MEPNKHLPVPASSIFPLIIISLAAYSSLGNVIVVRGEEYAYEMFNCSELSSCNGLRKSGTTRHTLLSLNIFPVTYLVLSNLLSPRF